MITKKQKKFYLKTGGTNCPFCGKSDSITGGSFEASGGESSQEISCLNCDKHWYDIYKLVDIEEVE